MWIAEWEWDDTNVGHIARHGLDVRDVLAVWRNEPKFRRNRRGRAATHQMVGPDGGGRFLAAFVRPVSGREGRWRVITARVATLTERDWWTRS